MAEARASSSLFLSIGSSFSVSVALFARLPEISVEFHYTPFGEQFSTDIYVAMVYMSRAGNYRPGDKKRMQWSLQKISAWGPAASLR